MIKRSHAHRLLCRRDTPLGPHYQMSHRMNTIILHVDKRTMLLNIAQGVLFQRGDNRTALLRTIPSFRTFYRLPKSSKSVGMLHGAQCPLATQWAVNCIHVSVDNYKRDKVDASRGIPLNVHG